MSRGCGCGKSTFTTQGKAEQAVRGIKRHGEQREKTPQRPYPCPTGKGWHLTSAAGDVKPRDRVAVEHVQRRAGRRRPRPLPGGDA